MADSIQETESGVPANQAGGGGVEGIGVGPRGEPGVPKKKKLRSIVLKRTLADLVKKS